MLLRLRWRSEAAAAAHLVIAKLEALANLAKHARVRLGDRVGYVRSMKEMRARIRAEGFGEEVKRRIMLGTFALSSGFNDECYAQAQKVRALEWLWQGDLRICLHWGEGGGGN